MYRLPCYTWTQIRSYDKMLNGWYIGLSASHILNDPNFTLGLAVSEISSNPNPTHCTQNPSHLYTEYLRTVYVYRIHTYTYKGRALIFLLKIQRIRARSLYVRGGIHEWQPVYGSALFTWDISRRWVFFSCSRPSRRTKKGRREKRFGPRKG